MSDQPSPNGLTPTPPAVPTPPITNGLPEPSPADPLEHAEKQDICTHVIEAGRNDVGSELVNTSKTTENTDVLSDKLQCVIPESTPGEAIADA